MLVLHEVSKGSIEIEHRIKILNIFNGLFDFYLIFDIFKWWFNLILGGLEVNEIIHTLINFPFH